jgi:putative RecB family exonuclease
MITYSNSKISTYLQCAKKYKFSYIDKIETEVENTIEAFMGDLVHRSLEKLYKDLNYMKLNTKEEILLYYDEMWSNEYNENILIVKEYSSDNYKDKGRQMIIDYYESYHPFNQGKTIGLETTDYYDLNDQYKIHVRIDRLVDMGDGVYEIHDYKTNNQLKTQIEADEDRQLAIYSMGVKEKYADCKKVILVWHMLAFNKEIRSERTQDELIKLKQDILDDIKRIESEEEFEPNKTALCDYCAYKEICPAWKHFFMNDVDSKELVDKFAKLKELEEKIQKKLNVVSEKIKLYAEDKGLRAVYGNNNIVTIWSKNTFKFPTKQDPKRAEFIAAMKSLSLFEVYSDVDTWVLEKDFDKLTEIEKQVLTHFALKTKIERLYLKKL